MSNVGYKVTNRGLTSEIRIPNFNFQPGYARSSAAKMLEG